MDNRGIREQQTDTHEHFSVVVLAMGAPADHVRAIVRILRLEFPTPDLLTSAAETYASRIGIGVPCRFTDVDCADGYAGVCQKAVALKACELMLRSHHDEPWGDE